ncbi:MAG TPA: NAD(P)H-dependent oxidoreductase subunit E, partial [Bacteroidia bacterium]
MTAAIKNSKAIKNSAELNALCESICRSKEHLAEKIYVCAGGGCLASGSKKVKEALEAALAKSKLSESVRVMETGCLGPCAFGPVVVIGKDETFYQKVRKEDVKDIVEQHLLGGKVVEKLLHPVGDKKVSKQSEIPYFKNQDKKVLKNCGKIDPTKITDYISVNGYQALSKVLAEMNGEQVVQEVSASGLRGRGGAGFPTGTKWSFARKSKGDVKYILCNADEGDPGAFMDRSVLEGDPHSVIEGMIIGAFAIGSH